MNAAFWNIAHRERGKERAREGSWENEGGEKQGEGGGVQTAAGKIKKSTAGIRPTGRLGHLILQQEEGVCDPKPNNIRDQLQLGREDKRTL